MLDPFYGKEQAERKIADSGWHIKHARDLARLLRNYPKLDLKAVGLDEMRGQYFDLSECIESVMTNVTGLEDVVHYMRACYANTIGVVYAYYKRGAAKMDTVSLIFHESPRPKILKGQSLVSAATVR